MHPPLDRALAIAAAVLFAAGVGGALTRDFGRDVNDDRLTRASTGAEHLAAPASSSSWSEASQPAPGGDRGKTSTTQARPGLQGAGGDRGATAAPTTPNDNMPLAIVVTPSCGVGGSAMQARISAVRGAYVGISVYHGPGVAADGPGYTGPVQDDGSYLHEWRIPAGAIAGEGSVLAAGTDPASGAQGTATATFRLAGPEGC